MRGTITTRHLVTHAALIVRLFGIRAYARCVLRALRRSRPSTFLDAACCGR